MKNIFVLFCLFTFISYSQSKEYVFDKSSFENYIRFTDVNFKMPEGFEQLQLTQSENFVSHPNLHSTLIMNKIFNGEKDVLIVFEVLPFEMYGKKVYKDTEISKCIFLGDYDVSQGKVEMHNGALEKYNVDLYANYPVRLFHKYKEKYDFCRKIYLQNNIKGRVVVLFFFNEEQRTYVSELSSRFYEYLNFSK